MELPQSDNNKKGFIAIIAVTILMAAGTIVAISIVLMSTDSFQITGAIQKSVEAQVMADSCAEKAISKLKANPTTYTGSETITIGTNTCQILVIKGSGNLNRTVQSTSTVGTYTKKVNVVLSQVNPVTSVTSWQEVADLP